MADAYLILMALFLFWMFIFILAKYLKLEKYGFDIAPFFLMYRTKRFNNIISRIAKKSPKFWKSVGTFGVAIAYAALGYGILALLRNLVNVFVQPQNTYPLVPIIPGITITGTSIIYVLIALVITLVTHELAHGIAAIAEGLPIKSAGLLFLIILPGGFVEMDEKALKKAPSRSRFRILSAGSATNLVTALFALLILSNFALVISPWYGPSVGVFVNDVEPYSPAYFKLPPSTVIFAINGTPIISDYGLILYLSNVKPFETLILDTSMGRITLTTSINPRDPTRGYIGIHSHPFYFPSPAVWWLGISFPTHLYLTFIWIHIVTFSVAIINMLPIYALDGGKLFEEVIRNTVSKDKKLKIAKKSYSKRKILVNSACVAAITLLVANIILPLLIVGFTPL
ncbi:MAG: site-2 protease family protein [Candidatus Jordarchaeum sp.]|uniref:site-2 protease family protein n=1 Tax=Candidatus Jordarchaeum sp. TaxID=2823881 RepID=UPI0040492087